MSYDTNEVEKNKCSDKQTTLEVFLFCFSHNIFGEISSLKERSRI